MYRKTDILIIGAGIVGLSIAKALLERNGKLKVVIIEKEPSLGLHSSGRNSGVIHAGFYYSPDSLKARFCREGNLALRRLCGEFNIPVREVGKVVVTKSDEEEILLQKLYERGKQNGIGVELLEKRELEHFEPLAVTKESFIWSPTTAVSDPKEVIKAMANKVKSLGGEIIFNETFTKGPDFDRTGFLARDWQAKHLVNAGGSQADRIAKEFGFAQHLTMIPFMGVYRSVSSAKLPLKRLVYPVPNPFNPFLGVHFTLSAHDLVKIGPTAIPLLNREQYSFFNNWVYSDMRETAVGIRAMLRGNFHNLPELVRAEFPKLFKGQLISEASKLVPSAREVGGWEKMPPGIRSQLIDIETGQLINDFLIEGDSDSTHILNAVSPGWTVSIPFGKHIADRVESYL